jgi:hypothetical protein
MKRTSLIALVAAFALAASPLTWARSSGFSSSSSSHSSFSSSRSSFSSGSSSSGRSSGFSSGFSSGGSGFTSAPARGATPSSGLGRSLYAANAGKAAASTYTANRASSGFNGGSGSGGSTSGYAYHSTPAYGGGNTYVYHSTPVYQPAPVVVNHYHTYDSGSSSSGFLWGWLWGSSMHHDNPVVVVQQPAQVQYVQPPSAEQYAPQAAPQSGAPAGTVVQSIPGANGTAQAVPAPATQPASGAEASHGHPVLHFLLWVAVLGGVSVGVWLLLSAWNSRKAGYTSTNHYKL